MKNSIDKNDISLAIFFHFMHESVLVERLIPLSHSIVHCTLSLSPDVHTLAVRVLYASEECFESPGSVLESPSKLRLWWSNKVL